MNTLAALAPRDLLAVHSTEHRATAATSAADAARLARLRAVVVERITAVRSTLAVERAGTSSPDLCCA